MECKIVRVSSNRTSEPGTSTCDQMDAGRVTQFTIARTVNQSPAASHLALGEILPMSMRQTETASDCIRHRRCAFHQIFLGHGVEVLAFLGHFG